MSAHYVMRLTFTCDRCGIVSETTTEAPVDDDHDLTIWEVSDSMTPEAWWSVTGMDGSTRDYCRPCRPF